MNIGWNWGDQLAGALEKIGVTKDRVSAWLGAPCNCGERQHKLNQLGAIAERFLTGKATDAEAKQHVEDAISDGKSEGNP